MAFSLHDPWGEADVADLLASVTDRGFSQLVIWPTGQVEIREASERVLTWPEVHLGFEVWAPGMGYCGPAASRDRAYVREIEANLRRNWPAVRDADLLV